MQTEAIENIKMIRDSARDFAETHIRPYVMKWDEAQHFPMDLFNKMGEFGFLGVLVPHEYGGAGLGYQEYITIIDEIGKVCGSIGLSVAAHNSLCTSHIMMFGNEEQKQKYLPKLATGQWIGAWGLTEPNTGSDAGRMQCVAEKDGDYFVLNGMKNFITHGKSGQVAVVIARTGELLDSLPRGETFDWVDTVSIELTTGMLAILFGFPWEDRRLLTYWSDWAGDTEIALVKDLTNDRETVLQEMALYFQQLWMKRTQEEPGSDLISMMIHSPAMNQMDPREFMGNLVLLIVGGNDTTRNTMSGIIHAFDKFPDQRKLFEENPDLIPNAVQECIRYQTPLAHMRRTASEYTELFAEQIKKGDKLILWYLSANRDEELFDNPDKLDIARENARRHLSFGYGIHRCVGARLAEMQLRILLEEMHKRRMRVHVAGDVERVRANFVHGFRKLEVEITEF